MITTPTTFVLGAGASADYGLPLGQDLIRSIATQVGVADGRHKNVAEWTGYSADLLAEFCHKIQASEVPSIDAWLARQPTFLQIGRTAIARAIHGSEMNQSLRAGWYGVLWNRMAEGCDTLKDFVERNRVTILTFNYDRSFEHFLSEKVRSLYPDAAENLGLLDRVRVLHIHGRAGRLAWQTPEHEAAVPYGTTTQVTKEAWEEAKRCHSHIRIMTENNSEAQGAIADAKSILVRSSHIIFLGFGFHRENISKIALEHGKSRASVWAAVHTSETKQLGDYSNSSKSPFGKEIAMESVQSLKDFVFKRLASVQ